MTLSDALGRYGAPLDAALRAILMAPSDEFKPFYGMQQYHQGWVDGDLQPVAADAGKRVRPTLCLLCCEACGGDYASALPLAAAIELEHGFSLVHDDIQDRSPTRRHRPTVWSLWGDAQAINVGDALYAAAHAAIYRLGRDHDPRLVLTLALGFEDVCLRLCEGQYLDMAFEREQDVSVDRYMLMIERKTADLISFAAWSGAAIAGAGAERAECFREMGRRLGLAFQIQDDVLGIWGDEKVTGKSASSDIAGAKKTLPYLHALSSLPSSTARELAAIYDAPLRDEAMVARARALIEATQARDRCLAAVSEHHAAALDLLARGEPLSEWAPALAELVARLSGRSQ